MNYPILNLDDGAKTASASKKTSRSSNAPPNSAEAASAFPSRRRFEVVETYFDADGRPVKRKGLGAARVARRYDESGNKVEEAYYNAEGKPTLRKDIGVARISWRYDERGNPVEAEYFAADGTPIEGENTGLAEKALSEEG